MRSLAAIFAAAIGALAPTIAAAEPGYCDVSACPVPEEITREATAENSDTFHPLPLVSTWNSGDIWFDPQSTADYMPQWQINQVLARHHLIPTFSTPEYRMLDPTGEPNGSLRWFKYFQAGIRQAAALNLPMAFAGTQWEASLYYEPRWFNLPPQQNPNMMIPGVVPQTTIGSVSVYTSGSGYHDGEILTMMGGTASVPTQVKLTHVDPESGQVHEATVTNPGQYTKFPAGPVSATGGSGKGVQFNIYDGAVASRLSVFGATAPWQDVGAMWTASTNPAIPGGRTMLSYLHEWYPNPPLVLYLSNNEALREQWGTGSHGQKAAVESDRHYLDKFGTGHTDEFKREQVASGWIERYRLMQSSMRNGFTNTNWQKNVRFIGYDAFGPAYFGRWSGWRNYSLYKKGRIDPNPLMWDGTSQEHYIGNGFSTDFKVWSTQVESMNEVFILDEARQLNPAFWYEISTWNSCDFFPMSSAPADDIGCKIMRDTAPYYSPKRYGGAMQFSMWLLRPRVVRDFRMYPSRTSESGAYFEELAAAVDKVYTTPVLRSFWRNSQLVANSAHLHPYQAEIPTEYATVPRNFMLDTNLDPARPWSLETEIPVFVLARLQGAAPHRCWLVYAQSPQKDYTDVRVTIPDYKIVSTGAKIAGGFYLVNEETGGVIDVETNIVIAQP